MKNALILHGTDNNSKGNWFPWLKSLLSNEMSIEYTLEEHGGLIISIDISSFTNLKAFKKSVSEMCNIIRKQKPTKGIDKLIIPGDSSYSRTKKTRKRGIINISNDYYNRLLKLSA